MGVVEKGEGVGKRWRVGKRDKEGEGADVCVEWPVGTVAVKSGDGGK